MIQNEQKSFGEMLIAIGELYNRKISRLQIRLYWQILLPYALQDISGAFKAHIEDPDTGQFMPKPADIVCVIKGGMECQSLQAWTKVARAIRLVGPYRSVVFDDPVIHSVIQEMGGWIKICSILEKDFPFVGKEFQTRYSAYRYRAPSCYPSHLIGLTEHKNSQLGLLKEPVMILGDRDKARAILDHIHHQTLQLEAK